MLVDDSSLLREIVTKYLSAHGYSVHAVASGAECLALLEHEKFDVAIVDIEMPGMSGEEVLAALCAHRPEIPVIIFSQHTEVDRVLQLVRKGAFDYVLKEEELESLRIALSRAIRFLDLRDEKDSLFDELRRVNRELDQKVHERTHQLQVANARLTLERSELERTLVDLRAAQTQLVHAEKAASIGVLAAGIAHEINNPLAFLLPNVELWRQWTEGVLSGQRPVDHVPDEEITAIAGECRDGLARIGRIVHQMCIYARPSTQLREPVNLSRLTRSVLSLLPVDLARRAQIMMDVQDLPPVLASACDLRQVLMNLVTNAADAVEGGAGEIRIGARQRSDRVALIVFDNGCGIPPEILDRVCDPFFTTKGVGKGTGLGLAVSRKLVERMGGKLELESREGKGTCVFIELPVWNPSSDDAPEDGLSAQAGRAP